MFNRKIKHRLAELENEIHLLKIGVERGLPSGGESGDRLRKVSQAWADAVWVSGPIPISELDEVELKRFVKLHAPKTKLPKETKQ